MESPNRTTNRIPAHASATLDVRFPPPGSGESHLSQIREVLGPKLNVDVIVRAEPTQFRVDKDFCRITQEVTNSEVTMLRSDGGSDARFIGSQGIPVIISRPEVGNIHRTDEWIDINSMLTFYQIYERFATERLS